MNGFFVGCLVGVVIMFGSYAIIPPKEQKQINAQKEQCEKNLPRSQSCVMQFVPEKK